MVSTFSLLGGGGGGVQILSSLFALPLVVVKVSLFASLVLWFSSLVFCCFLVSSFPFTMARRVSSCPVPWAFPCPFLVSSLFSLVLFLSIIFTFLGPCLAVPVLPALSSGNASALPNLLAVVFASYLLFRCPSLNPKPETLNPKP